MNVNYFDFYCTIFKNKDEKENVSDEREANENEYILFKDCIIPNRHVEIRSRESLLK